MRSLFTGTARHGPAAPCAASIVFALALAASALHAQSPNPPAEKGFVRSRAFDLPFNLTAADKTNVRELKLYVSSDPPREWQLHATATPAQTRYDARSGLQVGNFDVRLDREGTHSFAIMTVFNDGSSAPISVDQLRADQKVTVDTKPPSITLKPLPTRPRGDGRMVVGLEWKIEDENLVRNSIHLEGRWFGAAMFTNFARGANPEESDRQEWTIPGNQRMEIRLTAADRAGNVSVRTTILGSGVGMTTGNGGTSGSASDGMGARVPGPAAGQPGFKLVNTRTVKLQYKVRERPPSGLESIELYVTRVGNEWKKQDQKFDPPPPDSDTAEVTFEATEDGTYGLAMIARSRAGISQPPPKSNDPPQIWVEVDTTKPTAALKTVKLASPADGRSLVLEWKAEDKNLEALPIIFEYAEVDALNNPSPKWQELTTPLPNSGRYVCAAPQLSAGVYLFKVRMHVFDKAGNYSIIEHPANISADVARPQVEIIDVKTVRPDAAPRQP